MSGSAVEHGSKAASTQLISMIAYANSYQLACAEFTTRLVQALQGSATMRTTTSATSALDVGDII